MSKQKTLFIYFLNLKPVLAITHTQDILCLGKTIWLFTCLPAGDEVDHSQLSVSNLPVLMGAGMILRLGNSFEMWPRFFSRVRLVGLPTNNFISVIPYGKKKK